MKIVLSNFINSLYLTYVTFLSIASYFAYLIIDSIEKKLRSYK